MCPYTAVFQPFLTRGSEKFSKNPDVFLWGLSNLVKEFLIEFR